MTQLTPMLSQYLEIKGQNPDALLFYRMGDFYELFFEDAIRAAPVLEIQLTSRDRNAENPIPMCGVPYHSVNGYLQKLIAHGFKVALCEQVEDPAHAKGIVKREVVRVVTPALIGDPDLVPEDSTNLLVALECLGDGSIDVAMVDLLAGEMRNGILSDSKQLVDLLLQIPPKELLVSSGTEKKDWFRELVPIFNGVAVTVRDDYFQNVSERIPLKALERYLEETQKKSLAGFLGEPKPLLLQDKLRLDATALHALEVVSGNTPFRESVSLFDSLNRTTTAMGRRLLKEWLRAPLNNKAQIEERLECVGELKLKQSLVERLRKTLTSVRDLERLTTKTALGLSMPRDLVAIREILKKLPEIKAEQSTSQRLRALLTGLNELTGILDHLETALNDEPPATLRDGGIFRDTYSSQISEYRTLSRDAKGCIAAMEAKERERTGLSSLKIKFNKVFGYTIEITTTHLSKVPADYIRKQTIANGERFYTTALKEFEEKVVSAEHKLKQLEEALFIKLRNEVAEVAQELLRNSKILAEMDVLLSFGKISSERGYVRPQMHEGWELQIDEGRHPVIEQLCPSGRFVPNSIFFQEEETQTLIVTGPNMAGKSTYMRQVAILVLMAHAGCFVPAESAKIPITDAIFTRIGAADDLTRGQSTFMVEMLEVARILSSATSKSLLVIDEIGRGTSTYDGLSLAWSLLEYLHTQVGAKTLFATHFHEVTALEKLLPAVRNANVLVERKGDEVIFLHRVVEGSCNQSYGIEVARLANLPSKVLLRAKEILGHLETQSQRANRSRHKALELLDAQMPLFDEKKSMETRARTES